MAIQREYSRSHPHRESKESRKKSQRKSRLANYGLTQEDFDRLLEAQGHACGMCHTPFEEGQLIHVDHDHDCCKVKNRSCGKCVRGLLCHSCNVSLDHIERRYAMARVYLDQSLDINRRQRRPAQPTGWSARGWQRSTQIGRLADAGMLLSARPGPSPCRYVSL
jgi:hypothetical protein